MPDPAPARTTDRCAAATARELLASLEHRLAAAGGAARLEAEMLVMDALGCSRAMLYAHPTRRPTAAEKARASGLAERRIAGEPMAYLLGSREFWSLELEVTADTLIPRPETETLVEAALAHAPASAPRVADLGAGCGAVAIAFASERPDAFVVALELSAAAAAVARRNARRLGIANVAVTVGDWGGALATGRFDLVLSNPPYVTSAEHAALDGDPRHEPRAALDGGPDGLDCIRALAADARRCLVPGGVLLFEHGAEQAPQAAAVLGGLGFRALEPRRDVAGRMRVSGGVRQPGAG